MRNYTKSGKLIYNEITISPIFEKGTKVVRYFLGVQKDATREQNLIRQLKELI